MSGKLLVILIAIVSLSGVFSADCFGDPPVPMDDMYKKCCKLPYIFPIDVWKQCREKHTDRGCMASCALENVNVIVDDEVSFDAMFDLAKKNLNANGQEFWIPTVEKNMKYCVNQGNLLKDELLSTGDCNHLSKFIMFCMFINNMAVCPADVWIGGEGCDELKNFFIECPDYHKYRIMNKI